MSITISPARSEEIRHALLAWYDEHRRSLPWRDNPDLYRVWLSEIMLQQTRVNQALPYYERFTEAFPTLEALASAELDAVLRQWEGLGYYARARNLHNAARRIVRSDSIPRSLEELLALPGIGPYTGRAIASIVFGAQEAAVDGNVRRVLARLFALAEPTPRTLQQLADRLVDRKRPGDYNQAVMELGALVCTPKTPKCESCPIGSFCLAKASGTPATFPASRKRPPLPHFDIATGVLTDQQGCIFIQRRPATALLGGLWELPGGKRKPGETVPAACKRELREELGIDVAVGELVCKVKHAYTHFKITLWAYRCCILRGSPLSSTGLQTTWVHPVDFEQFAFPRANRRVLEAIAADTA